jgi:hypothetical protein
MTGRIIAVVIALTSCSTTSLASPPQASRDKRTNKVRQAWQRNIDAATCELIINFTNGKSARYSFKPPRFSDAALRALVGASQAEVESVIGRLR